MTPDRIRPIGLGIPWPVISGAALAADVGAGSAVHFVPIGYFTSPLILESGARQRVRIEAL
ncbi:MAG: hypothetical protein HY803_06610 [candidate division NC10 bacterium]|nr:hypothetical protein [candidate division NC10 bacterium]